MDSLYNSQHARNWAASAIKFAPFHTPPTYISIMACDLFSPLTLKLSLL